VLHTWARPAGAAAGAHAGADVLGVDYESSPSSGAPPQRHALTFVVDGGDADCVLEVAVSAPAMLFDALWEGEEGCAEGEAAGLAGRGGLRAVVESLTLTSGEEAEEAEEEGEGARGDGREAGR
jgi:hypothetical protein